MGNIYLGAIGWSYKFWDIYKDTKPAEYLTKYSETYNSVEINNTFYRIPRKTSVETWRRQTTSNFRFAVKFPNNITHNPGLQYDPEKLDIFLDHLELLAEKKGSYLLQLPPKLSSEHLPDLKNLLEKLPSGQRYAVEFREKDWFNESTYKLLRDYKIALVYVEHPWLPTAMVQTTDFVYVRLEGDRKKVNGEKGIVELDRTPDNHSWAEKIRRFSERGQDVYCYISKFYSGYPPADLDQITSKLETLKESQ